MKKLALLGFDSHTLPVCQYVQTHEEMQLTAIADVTAEQGEQLLRTAPGVELVDWEDLLSDELVEFVVIAASTQWEERIDQLTRLVGSGKSILVTTPICESLKAVELQFSVEDRATTLLPLVPDRRWAFWSELIEWIADKGKSPVGEIQQLVLQRDVSEPFNEQPLPHLANDILLFERLIGRFSRVSALSTSREVDDWRGTTVSLIGDAEVVAQWTNSTGSGDSMLVLGRDGQAVIRWDEDSDSCQLEVGSETKELGQAHRAPFVAESLQGLTSGADDHPTWQDLCRCLETADVVERSRRRGRTIELHQEERSEESSFKGVMATGSCLILMLAFLLLLVFSLVEGIRLPFARNNYERQRKEAQDAGRPMPEVQRTHILLRLWPFYPFAAFLLLQLFRLIVPSREANRKDEGEDEVETEDSG